MHNKAKRGERLLYALLLEGKLRLLIEIDDVGINWVHAGAVRGVAFLIGSVAPNRY